VIAMTRSLCSLALAAVVTGVSACASNAVDSYAQVSRARMECPTGSHICREVDPRTGRAHSLHPVVTIQVNGTLNAESLGAVLGRLPFFY
jgi:hypothetical protein